MDTKALRQKILDLAIRGKLVPQDPNDEPASVLLERIHAEKQQMVKDGKLKPKDIKNDTVIFKGDDNLHYEKFADGSVKCVEDEIPFELPEGWEWTRLGCIGNWQSGATPSRRHPEYYGGSIPWLKTGDLNDGFINSVSEYITEEGINNSSAVLNPVGSVLIAMYGATIGKLGIANIEVTTNQACCACLPILIINQYLFYFLMYQKKYFIEKAVGGAQPNISKKKIVATLFPVPPFREQKKIVSTVNNLLSKIDSIVKNKNEITNTIITTKSKILDLAIRGKLVPQDPNDEPASALLERIQSKKEELIKQGKIKRNKKESVIFKGSDNSYYEKYGEKLPSGWVITNFETLLSYEQPTNYIVKDTNYNSEYETPVLTAGKSFILGYTDEKENIFSELPVIIFDDFTTESKFVDFPFKVKSSAMKILHINTVLVLPKFAFYLMQATQIDHDNHQRYWISTYSREEIALPPLKEQERILSALEQYFKLLNCLL